MKKKVKIVIAIVAIIVCYYVYVKKDSPTTSDGKYSTGITMSNTRFVVDQNYVLTADSQVMNSDQSEVNFTNPKLVSKTYTLQSDNGVYNKSANSVELTNNVVLNYNNNGSKYILKSNKVDYTASNQKIVSSGETHLQDVSNSLTVDSSSGITTYQNSPIIQLHGDVVLKNASLEIDGTDVTYDRNTQILTSQNPMTIKSTNGNVTINKDPKIDVKNEILSGNSAILIKGESKVYGNALTYSQLTKTSNLNGNVHGVIVQNGDTMNVESDNATLIFDSNTLSNMVLDGNVNLNSQDFGQLQAAQVNYTSSSVVATGSVKCVVLTNGKSGALNTKKITIYGDMLQTNFNQTTKQITLLNVVGNARMLADNGQYVIGNTITSDFSTYFNVLGNANVTLDSTKEGKTVVYHAIGDNLKTTYIKSGNMTTLSTLNLTGKDAKLNDSTGNFLVGSNISLVCNVSLNASGNVSGKIIGSNTLEYQTNAMALTLGAGNQFVSGIFDGNCYIDVNEKNQVWGDHISCNLQKHRAESSGNAKLETYAVREGSGKVTYTLTANTIKTVLSSDNKGVKMMTANQNAVFDSSLGDSTQADTIVLDNTNKTLTATGGVTGNWVNTSGNIQTRKVAFGANSILVNYVKPTNSTSGSGISEVSSALMSGNAYLKTANGVLNSSTINYNKLQGIIIGNDNVSVNYSAINSKGQPYHVVVTGEKLNYILAENKIYVTQNVVSNLISDGSQVSVTGENAMFDNVAQKIYFSNDVTATGKELNIANIDEGVYDIVAQNLKIYGYNIRYNYK